MLCATRTASATSNEEEDHEKSVADWGRKTKESLVLQYNGCGLDGKGNKLNLQRRLFNHFHPASVDINQLTRPIIATSIHSRYNCHLEGHFAGACPLKKSRMMTNPNANLGPPYSSPPHAHLQSAIHQPIPTTDMANHGQISYAKRPAN